MNRLLHTVPVLLALMLPVESYPANEISGEAAKILKLKKSPEEVIDSVFKFVSNYRSENVKDSLVYAECENFYRTKLVPYATKRNCGAGNMAKIYDNIGQMSNRQGKNRIENTREAYDKALEYAKSGNDYYRQGLILEHMSLSETNYGNMADGFRLSEEAIKAYGKSEQNAEKRITRCYYTQAVTYLHQMDMAGLKRVIDALEKFAAGASDANRAFVLYNLYSVQEVYYGTLLESDQKIDRKAVFDTLNGVSLASVQLADDNYEQWRSTSMDPTWNYYNRAVLFENSSDRPNVDSVEYYLNKALAVNHSGKGNYDFEAEISASSLRAEMWMKYGNYEKAKKILEETLESLDRAEGINNVLFDKIEIYKNLMAIARESGHYEEALDYAAKVSDVEKQRYSDERAKAVKELEIKYQTQETALALAKSEARRANALMWLMASAGLLLVAMIIFVIYANRQRRRRLQREMEFANLRADIGRQLTQQYVEGLENERKRMASELHDGVCNDLLAIQMNIANGTSIENTAEMIDSCRESVRRISHELMPPEFAYASLDEVVRFFVTKQAKANADKMSIIYESSVTDAEWGDVPDSVALEIYRTVQEAVGNAIKHSGATEIAVSLNRHGDILEVRIIDNGTYRPTGKKGVGLESMRRRANAISGSISIEGANGGGTSVNLVVKI